MKRFFIFVLAAALLSFQALAVDYVYTDARNLTILGKALPDTYEPFSRLPASMKATARAAVWNLGRNSAGLAIRFSSDAGRFSFKWTTTARKVGDNMSAILKKGLALYVLDGKEWVFAGTARPRAEDGNYEQEISVSKLGGSMHEYMLYLALYDGVTSLSIGVDKECTIKASEVDSPRRAKPVVMYGTSILQGASASHPGLCSTNLLERMLDREVINLGFSGNALLDADVAELMAAVPDPGVYVLDFVPNGGAKLTLEKGEAFFNILRKAHPDVPVVFVECPFYPGVRYDNAREQSVNTRNEALKEVYSRIKASGAKKIYYVKGDKLLPEDNIGTIEGTHFTDIGFKRYSDVLYLVLKKILKSEDRK